MISTTILKRNVACWEIDFKDVFKNDLDMIPEIFYKMNTKGMTNIV